MIDLASLKGKKIAILGLAKTGLATAKALMKAEANVVAWDDNAVARDLAMAAGVIVTDLTGAQLSGIEALVLSPGIPHTHPAPHPAAAAAKAAGIPIISDIELLHRVLPKACKIGITGTNGKSTTTALVGHILKSAGRACGVGGNLGTPALTLGPLPADGVFVLEMSSYQLELSPGTVFDVAVLLNITPDHLARHGGIEGYVAAKALIFADQTPKDTAIIGVDTEYARLVAEQVRQRREAPALVTVSVRGEATVTVRAGKIYDRREGPEPVIDIAAVATLLGAHNWENAAAAYAAARAAGVSVGDIQAAMLTFPGLEHRQQLIATVNGVAYVNDSKATNADATTKALACYDNIYLIAGGRPKEGGLNGIEPFFPRIRHVYLIGEAAGDFAAWLGTRLPWTQCGDLATATAAASAAAVAGSLPGAVVLLSPACASWDQFKSFEDRGEQFAALVKTLAGTGVSVNG